MNPDELQELWAEHDRRLDQNLRLNQRLFRELHLDQARSTLARLEWGLGLEFATDALVVLWLGSRLGEQLSVPRFGIPVLLLFLAWTSFLALSLRQLTLAENLDFAAPIAALQRQVETLRLARLSNTKWRLLSAPVLWTPLLIVVLQSFFGVDAWTKPGGAWLAANLLVGVLLVPVLLWIARRLGERPASRNLVERLLRSVSGRCIARAEERLDAIAAFERGES